MVLTTRLVTIVIVVLAALSSSTAHAQRTATSDALDRLGEALRADIEDGSLRDVAPIILVGAKPAFESTRAWFPTEATSALANAFGRTAVRACEACLQPRVYSREGRLQFSSESMSLEEIVALDARTRGRGAPAQAAAWIDETDDGISVRIVSLATGQILFAQNLDGRLHEQQRTGQNFNYTNDVQRRLRGESLTHVFIDLAAGQGGHVSMDVVDQFGTENRDMAGLTLSVWDPLVGVGVNYHRVFPEAWNLSVGGQLIVSVPTAAGNAFGFGGDIFDPLFTGVLVLRWPIPQTSYAILGTASTNGNFGIGISLMNFSLLPVLP